MTIKELQTKRKELVRIQQKEYTTMGNTKKCQKLFEEICKVDEMIADIKKEA